jgi:fatty-acyl-CoA synthase
MRAGLPSLPVPEQLRARLARVQAARQQGAALMRILSHAGVTPVLRPGAMTRFLASVRNAVIGPHLSVTLQATVRPDSAALADARRRLTYGELEHEINQVAHALIGLGVAPGDRVGIMLPNCIEFLTVLSALPRIGATAVQIGYRLKAGEIAYILENARPRVVVHDALYAGEMNAARATAGAPPDRQVIVVDTHGTGNGAARAPHAMLAYPDAIAGQPGDRAPARRSREAGGVIIYTSGTTGKPKGARRSFSKTGLTAVADMMQQVGMGQRDRHLVVCPLYHSAAPAFALMMLTLGGSLVVTDHFEAEEILALIEREAITSAFMVPTMLVRLTSLEPSVRSRYNTSSLRWILSGAAPLPTETARRFQEAYGPILWNFYGATETGLVTLAGPAEHTARPGTIGRALDGNQLRVLDESGGDVAAGEVGELYVRNSMLITEYHGDEAATRGAMRDGFFSVGDLARIDGDGYVYLASRVHDMVISGGVNIYPAEIEEHLHRHPEVLEAAVIGVPDEMWGERLKAFVVSRPGSQLTAEDVVQFCREGLADFKRPREVVFVDALPRNPTGKVLKRELRAM